MLPSLTSSGSESRSPAQAFLPLDCRNPNHRTQIISRISQHSGYPQVADILRRQNQRWGLSPAAEAHLDALARPETTVVVTGQQMGLFLGPLYTFYKAATAIIVARTLSQETGKTVIPVFWLQTEDHDFAEISSCYVPRTAEAPLQLNMTDDADETSARRSISERTLGPNIVGVLDTLAHVLGDLPHANTVMSALRQAYQPHTTWGDAFATWLAACFAEEGLILLDPRDPELATLGSIVHAKAIEHHNNVEHLLLQRAKKLEDAGLPVQVPVGKHRCLSFFHPDGSGENRYRLVVTEGGFQIPGQNKVWSWPELRQILESSPLQWSTSALLRPLWQDHLLPTVGYVGGPGEISYFTQIQPLYEFFERPMPLVIPRARFVLVDHKSQQTLRQWGLTAQDMTQPEDVLLSKIQASLPVEFRAEEIRQALLGAFSQALQPWQDAVVRMDEGLQKMIEKTVGSVEQAVDKLVQKIERTQLHRDHALVQKLQTLRMRLFPNNQPQERILSLPYFAAMYGVSPLKQAIQQHYVPFSADVGELRL